jgi:hypothetical protein
MVKSNKRDDERVTDFGNQSHRTGTHVSSDSGFSNSLHQHRVPIKRLKICAVILEPSMEARSRNRVVVTARQAT